MNHLVAGSSSSRLPRVGTVKAISELAEGGYESQKRNASTGRIIS